MHGFSLFGQSVAVCFHFYMAAPLLSTNRSSPPHRSFPPENTVRAEKKAFFALVFWGEKGYVRVQGGYQQGHAKVISKRTADHENFPRLPQTERGVGNCFLLPERLNFSWSPPPPDDKFRPAYLVGNFLVLSWGGINQAAVSRGGETKRSDCADIFWWWIGCKAFLRMKKAAPAMISTAADGTPSGVSGREFLGVPSRRGN